MTFQPSPPIRTVRKVAEQTTEELPVYEIDFSDEAAGTLDDWVNRTIAGKIDIVLFAWDKSAVGKLRIRATTRWVEFVSFIQSIARDCDPIADSILLYKKDYDRDWPQMHPCQSRYYSIVQHLFSAKDNRKHLFYRVIKDVPQAEVEDAAFLPVDFSLDGIEVVRTAELVVSGYASFGELAQKFIALGFVPGGDRFLAFRDGCIHELTQAMSVTYVEKLFVSRKGEPPLGRGEKNLFLMLVEIDERDYLEPSGFPTSITITRQMTLAEAKPHMAKLLGMSGDQIRQVKCFLGARWVQYAPGKAVGDHEQLWDLGQTKTLYVLADPKKRRKRYHMGEGSVKIDN
jgi:hypothetical protein